MTSPLLLSVPVLLGGAALALALRSNRTSAVVAVGSQTLAAALVLLGVLPVLRGSPAVEVTRPWSAPIGDIALRVDSLGAFFLAWSLPMTLLATVYAVGYLRPYFDRGRHGGPHFALLNMTALAFVIVYSVQNALVFLLGWEIAAVSAWLLVIWDYENQKIRFAGFNYLVSTHVGLFVLVAAFMLLHSKTGSMDFAAFGAFLSRPSASRGTLFLLLGVAFALKSAFFPFHTWLPRAHSAAPAHVSALMSGVIHKAGLFAFLRFTLLLAKPEEWMGWTVLAFGAVSALFGALYSSTQRDLKRLLGYSSTENVGIAAVGFGFGYLGLAWGIPSFALAGFGGGLLHLVNHAVFKCLLFYGAGSVYRATHTVDIERLGGLAKKLPVTAAFFLVAGLAIAGLPPFNGFLGEMALYTGLFSGAGPSPEANVALVAAAAALAFAGAVGALSITRAFGVAFLGSPREPMAVVGPEAPAWMLAPMALHAVGVVGLGVLPGALLWLVRAPLALLAPASTSGSLAALVAPYVLASRLLFAALALACVLGWRARRASDARESVTWGCGYTAPSPRMQYTGSAFSEAFARTFDAFLPAVTRERLPTTPFPQQPSRRATHYPDPVERRMFEVLGQGEDFVAHASDRIPEQPRFAFAAGLLALVVIALVVVGGMAGVPR